MNDLNEQELDRKTFEAYLLKKLIQTHRELNEAQEREAWLYKLAQYDALLEIARHWDLETDEGI